MNSRSLMFHSAAWAFASAARALESALEIQKRYVESVPQDGAKVGPDDPIAGDDPAVVNQECEGKTPVRQTSTRQAPLAPEPASQLIARARRSIQSRHYLTER